MLETRRILIGDFQAQFHFKLSSMCGGGTSGRGADFIGEDARAENFRILRLTLAHLFWEKHGRAGKSKKIDETCRVLRDKSDN